MSWGKALLVASMLLGSILLGSVSSGCEAAKDTVPASGELGIFYGGQIQQREVVRLDPERLPSFGFRLQLGTSSTPRRVKWEVTRPGPSGRRVTELGSVDLERNRATFDREVPLDRGSPLGTWNVRVTVDGLLVIDRAIVFER